MARYANYVQSTGSGTYGYLSVMRTLFSKIALDNIDGISVPVTNRDSGLRAQSKLARVAELRSQVFGEASEKQVVLMGQTNGNADPLLQSVVGDWPDNHATS